jgi:hypothetical protein
MVPAVRQVSIIDLPQEARGVVGDELPLTFGAAKIEALARQAEESGKPVEMGPPGGAELALMMTSEVGRYRVERVYWAVGAGVLRGTVESIRTALVELVTEIRAAMPAEDAAPTPEAIGQAVQLAVSGKRNRVTFAAAGAGGTATATSGGGTAEERRFWTWPRVGMFIVGLATLHRGNMTTPRKLQRSRDAGKDVVLCMARCPDPNCSAPAEVYAEVIHNSTGGPVPHARTFCLNRHFHNLPVEYIPGMPTR